MGICCSIKHSDSTNQFENFLYDIFNELKIRKYSFSEVLDFYNNATIKTTINGDEKSKEVIILSKKNI